MWSVALTREQLKVLQAIHAVGAQVGASPKELKAAVETGLVESGLRNLPGGDADSQGWRQERSSIYKDPRNLDASIRRFFGETRAVKGKYGSAGALAAAVQRPAAQYRGRYQERSGEADALLRSLGASSAQAGSSGPSSRQVTTMTPGTSSFDPGTESAGAGLSDILAASLSSQKQQAAPAAQLEAPSFSSSRYVQGAALPQASGASAPARLDVGSAIAALEAAPAVAEVQRTPGTTTTRTVATGGQAPVQARGGGSGSLKGMGLSPLKELFWQGSGGVDIKNGQKVPQGFVSGHTDHVHVAAGPKTVVALGKIAQEKFGLNVGENSHFNGGQRETSGHAPTSYHYRDQAIDVSGDPAKMRAYAAYIARLAGVKP